MTKHNRSILCCRSAVCPHPSLSRAQILFSSRSRAPVGVLRHVHCKLVWGEGWYGVGIDTEDHSYTVSAQHDILAPKRLIHLLDLWKSIWAFFFTPQVLQTLLLVCERCLASLQVFVSHAAADTQRWRRAFVYLELMMHFTACTSLLGRLLF